MNKLNIRQGLGRCFPDGAPGCSLAVRLARVGSRLLLLVLTCGGFSAAHGDVRASRVQLPGRMPLESGAEGSSAERNGLLAQCILGEAPVRERSKVRLSHPVCPLSAIGTEGLFGGAAQMQRTLPAATTDLAHRTHSAAPAKSALEQCSRRTAWQVFQDAWVARYHAQLHKGLTPWRHPYALSVRWCRHWLEAKSAIADRQPHQEILEQFLARQRLRSVANEVHRWLSLAHHATAALSGLSQPVRR